MIERYEEYLKYELNYSNYTIKEYIIHVKEFLFYCDENKIDYLNINKDIIIDYLKKIDNLSNKSISAILSSLRCFYNYLLDNKMIEVNYFKLISNPKLEKKLPTFLSYEDIRKVIDSIEETDTLSIRNKMIIELLYATGIRVSELKNIKIKDINLSEKSIKVMGKGSKERIVFFNNHSLIAINKYLENRGFNNDYLVLNNKGKEITVRGIELIIKNVIDKACLKVHVSPHTFRHTFATISIEENQSINALSELLGHAKKSTTLDMYVHSNDTSKERLATSVSHKINTIFNNKNN